MSKLRPGACRKVSICTMGPRQFPLSVPHMHLATCPHLQNHCRVKTKYQRVADIIMVTMWPVTNVSWETVSRTPLTPGTPLIISKNASHDKSSPALSCWHFNFCTLFEKLQIWLFTQTEVKWHTHITSQIENRIIPILMKYTVNHSNVSGHRRIFPVKVNIHCPGSCQTQWEETPDTATSVTGSTNVTV